MISDKKIADIKIPLLCFDTEFENHEIERLYEKVLEKHEIELRDFVIRSIPDITPMGFSRNLIAKVKNMEIGKLEQDELNENMKKCIVKFELGKGSYATIVISVLFNL